MRIEVDDIEVVLAHGDIKASEVLVLRGCHGHDEHSFG
jgi:hypothetical protein